MNDDNNFFDNDNDAQTLEKYTQYYSNDNLWSKIKKHYKNIGNKLIKLVVVLFYTLRDDDTPAWAKTIILGALGYFILPLDVIPDFIPIVGFTDDFATIVLALAAVTLHIKDEHKDKATTILSKLFNNKN
jgi:uncharacterized membrane protein YkvA (DUF1232 family)